MELWYEELSWITIEFDKKMRSDEVRSSQI